MAPPEAPVEAPRARELRGQVREWRRGRAELNYQEILSDAYIAIFAIVMVGSMAGNVVLNLRRLADVSCTGTCSDTRALAPWLSALAVAALALGVARLLGPVFSPPAANTWLLSTPVDRGALLRPGWLRTVATTLSGAVLVLLAPALLGGFGAAEVVAFVVAGSAASLACVALAALSQLHQHPAARWLTWLVTGSLWLLLALTADARLGAVPTGSRPVALALVGIVLVLAAVLTRRVHTSMASMSRRILGQTEHLSPALSGALSSLDLGLMYDVLLARRWGKGATVRSRRGGPRGWWALVHRDLLRALRAPQPYVVLAGMALVPYAAASADAGRPVVLTTTLAGLLAGPALCAGLRVVVRTQGMARMLPMSGASLRGAHLVVPGTALVTFGLASTWALLPLLPVDQAVIVALACGLSALAATVRWVTARPPDYGKPMVSTPMGAVPPGLFASLFRGFDIWAITALPLTFGPIGTSVSIAISLGVIAFLVSSEPA